MGDRSYRSMSTEQLHVVRLLKDVKDLTESLSHQDAQISDALRRADRLTERIKLIKKYQDLVKKLNSYWSRDRRHALVAGLQDENRRIRRLQEENASLQEELTASYDTLKSVVERHRSVVSRIEDLDKEDTERELHQKPLKDRDRSEKTGAILRLLDAFFLAQERSNAVDDLLIDRLRKENSILRELLNDPCTDTSTCNGDLEDGERTPADDDSNCDDQTTDITQISFSSM
ncbi:hypothetical protein AB6A40_000919 [Gnathostoma spinigerum]|uniref:Uncharacterized protein n=1 Tax=Gnathostoma spinigerum TaxID=75299 RepID=A0ABD6E316_9BILA